jgi:hypothetical protein
MLSENHFFVHAGTEIETLRSLTVWSIDKTKFNELIESRND